MKNDGSASTHKTPTLAFVSPFCFFSFVARYSLSPSLFDFSVSCLLISSKGIGEKNLTFSCVSGSVESENFRVFSISWRGISGKMAGKGGKGLLAAKTMAAGKDKDKKKPVSRSSRAGLQVLSLSLGSSISLVSLNLVSL